MIGLNKLLPLLRRKNLNKVNHRIFCHAISKAFLIRKFSKDCKDFKDYERFIKEIEINDPFVSSIYDKTRKEFYKVKITAIPANHCPGSVMFLFEKLTSKTVEDGSGSEEEKATITYRVLYTGDFRFENFELNRLSALHEVNGNPKSLDQLYLDTTFCSNDYLNFPSRETAIGELYYEIFVRMRALVI